VTALLTTERAAQELGVSAEQIRRYVNDGELHPINVGRAGRRRCLRFEPSDIETSSSVGRLQEHRDAHRLQTGGARNLQDRHLD